jgi:hypothetical protein
LQKLTSLIDRIRIGIQDSSSKHREVLSDVLAAFATRPAELRPHGEPVPLILAVAPIEESLRFGERGLQALDVDGAFIEALKRGSYSLPSHLMSRRFDRRHAETPLLGDSHGIAAAGKGR